MVAARASVRACRRASVDEWRRVSSPSRPEDEAASTVSFLILTVEETKELRARNARCDYILNECDAQRRSSED